MAEDRSLMAEKVGATVSLCSLLSCDWDALRPPRVSEGREETGESEERGEAEAEAEAEVMVRGAGGAVGGEIRSAAVIGVAGTEEGERRGWESDALAGLLEAETYV